MTRTALTQGVWTKVADSVTSFAFNLQNTYPDPTQKCGYKIHWGTEAPATDVAAFNYYELDHGTKVYAYPVQFTNSTAANIYVMPVFGAGAITY